jgi:phage pi2 protein 07
MSRAETESDVREMQEYARQLRKNALELDDLVDELQWIEAGGHGVFNPERFDRLVTACRRMCEDMEEMDFPEQYGGESR